MSAYFFIGVVVARGQAQARLLGEADLDLGVLEIGAGAEAEHLLVAFDKTIGDVLGDVGGFLQRVDLVEQRLDRLVAELVDGVLIHAGLV